MYIPLRFILSNAYTSPHCCHAYNVVLSTMIDLKLAQVDLCIDIFIDYFVILGLQMVIFNDTDKGMYR